MNHKLFFPSSAHTAALVAGSYGPLSAGTAGTARPVVPAEIFLAQLLLHVPYYLHTARRCGASHQGTGVGRDE